jgi:acyl-coenzyme A synthetase/AMP-(fatty) acid ligase
MNVAELFVRQALATPQRQALVAGGQAMTYGELYDSVRRLAAAFAAAGVERRETVAVTGSPGNQVASALALAWLGAVSVEGGGESSNESVLSGLGVNHHFFSGTQPCAFDHPEAKGQGSLEGVLAGASPDAAPTVAAVEPAEPWRIAVSSGTTGRPKGIAYSHQASVTNVNLLRAFYPTLPRDRVLIAMPARMGFAVHNWLRCFTVGATAVVAPSLPPEALLRIIHELGVTHALVTPDTAAGMAVHARDAGGAHAAPAASLRALSVGGARVSPQVQALLRQHVCPQLFVHYGASETHLVSVLDPATQKRYPRSAGRLLPWVEAQAVGPDGQPLAPGEPGPLRLRTPTLALGYVRPAGEQEARAFRGGWFYSTDVGTVSPEGIVRLAGRTNDVININGVKVNPEVVEDAIQQDPVITDCAVVDVPNALGQPVLAVALVATTRDIDLDGLRRRCLAVSAPPPRLVVHVGQLPRNESGKVMRDPLRKSIVASAAARAGALDG